jgi:hypothetical protein
MLPHPRPGAARHTAQRAADQTDSRVQRLPETGRRGGLIDEVDAASACFSSHAGACPRKRPRNISDKWLKPWFFNRACEVGRRPGDRWGCRRGDSAGERVPYDHG